MTRPSRAKSNSPKPLPPPTASEAAFERLLAEFGTEEKAPTDVEAFIAHAFANRDAYAQRDPFAGIGERDSFPTKVVGISFEGRQDVAAGLVPGLALRLERQRQNPADANAIAVFYGALQIGFLRKPIAKHLAPLIDGGVPYRARIEHVTGGPSKNGGADRHYGVNIRVERDAARAATSAEMPLRAGADRHTIRRALIGEYPLHDAQRCVLERLDAGKNALAVLGTGRGKSFCFQYPAACRALESGQKTLVLYPLRALANDQFEALSRRLDPFGLRIFRANGAIASDERAALMGALQSGAWDVILATPEFLQFHRSAFTGASAPSLLVIDEAHHTFEARHRPAYAGLAQTADAIGAPQMLALTATAGDEAFAHIRAALRIDAWVIDPTVRENLHVTDARETADKTAYLRSLFEDGGKAIVYCNSRTESSRVADALRKHFRNDVMFYHAGMPTPERAQVETYFRSGALRVVVATSAFGEGIDLPDVRHVVLYHLNFDFTEFNQQAGRAGRDGEPAQIHLLYGERDRRINEFIIDQQSPPLPVLRELYRGMRGLARGSALRLSLADIASTLDITKTNERTVGAALRIFEDEGLVESGIDDDGRYVTFKPVAGKVDLTQNERFAEGEAERESFARFAELALKASGSDLERIINRPIYPERIAKLC